MRNFLSKLFGIPQGQKEHSQEVEGMIKGIHNLNSQLVKDVMVPRVDMIAIDDELEIEDILALVMNSTFSRFPVYHNTIDNIVGLVYGKDLLKVSQDIENVKLNDIIRKAFFVTETMRLDILLREMKKRRMHMALVVDEYGGISGLVSLEDIIEEIVGEIQDEFDNDDEEFITMSNNVYLVDGRLPISKFNDFLSLHISDDEIDTVGGFVYSLFGKIPVCYEKVEYRDNETGKTIQFIVQGMIGNKIKSIKATMSEE